jgi:hypothetical protein
MSVRVQAHSSIFGTTMYVPGAGPVVIIDTG